MDVTPNEASTFAKALIPALEPYIGVERVVCPPFISLAVQRGLGSRAYIAGRLSVRREAGEHLFHRLLHADLTSALNQPAAAD